MDDPVRRLLFDIAVATGSGWDIDDMAAKMPLPLLYEWVAYRELYPLMFDANYRQSRADWNAAMTAVVIRNALVATFVKDPNMLDIADVIFQEQEPRPQKSPQEIYALFKSNLALYQSEHKH